MVSHTMFLSYFIVYFLHSLVPFLQNTKIHNVSKHVSKTWIFLYYYMNTVIPLEALTAFGTFVKKLANRC